MPNMVVLVSAETPDRRSKCREGHEGRERPRTTNRDVLVSAETGCRERKRRERKRREHASQIGTRASYSHRVGDVHVGTNVTRDRMPGGDSCSRCRPLAREIRKVQSTI